ncbi:hypothetical protein THAOC_35420, partial [Thalassiosira oceanica]
DPGQGPADGSGGGRQVAARRPGAAEREAPVYGQEAAVKDCDFGGDNGGRTSSQDLTLLGRTARPARVAAPQGKNCSASALRSRRLAAPPASGFAAQLLDIEFQFSSSRHGPLLSLLIVASGCIGLEA